MLSRNYERFVEHLAGDGRIQLALEDEVIKGPLVTHGGEIVHKGVADACEEAD